LIESRDAFESHAATHFCELAIQLKRAGHEVVLYLVQNAVLGVRAKARPLHLHQALAAGIKVLADDLSARERGIAPSDVASGVQSATPDQAVTLLAAGWKTIWH
jgi:predicted peroxiredoxin